MHSWLCTFNTRFVGCLTVIDQMAFIAQFWGHIPLALCTISLHNTTRGLKAFCACNNSPNSGRLEVVVGSGFIAMELCVAFVCELGDCLEDKTKGKSTYCSSAKEYFLFFSVSVVETQQSTLVPVSSLYRRFKDESRVVKKPKPRKHLYMYTSSAFHMHKKEKVAYLHSIWNLHLNGLWSSLWCSQVKER